MNFRSNASDRMGRLKPADEDMLQEEQRMRLNVPGRKDERTSLANCTEEELWQQ